MCRHAVIVHAAALLWEMSERRCEPWGSVMWAISALALWWFRQLRHACYIVYLKTKGQIINIYSVFFLMQPMHIHGCADPVVVIPSGLEASNAPTKMYILAPSSLCSRCLCTVPSYMPFSQSASPKSKPPSKSCPTDAAPPRSADAQAREVLGRGLTVR